jgi:single-strand DNA-binding protein
MQGNKVILIGYVGKDIVSKTLDNGDKMVSIRVATHYKSISAENAWVDHTVWHNILAWGSKAGFAERSFVKGSKILVEGFIEYNTYPDRNGHTRYTTHIKAQSLMNLDR